ncbi:MAG: glycosyltransferase, partial [Aeriscardovia sp.]|nr:glycosyltransferase [Aeriscardovia sp.]
MCKLEMKKLLRRLSPYTIKKGLLYLRHYGPKEFWIRLHERFEPEEIPYGPWYEAYRPGEERLLEQRKKKYKNPPLLSLCVPVYHPPKAFLEAMIESVLAQTYPHWELCLVQADPEDEESSEVLRQAAARDERIRVKILQENEGIAANTNEALAMARGQWLGFLDHDDVLPPEALFTFAQAILKHPKARMMYSDEDKLSPEGEHFQPHLKPDFNLDLLRSNNYICHLLFVERKLYEEVGPISSSFDGAQDYDFILRCAEGAMGGDLLLGSRPDFEGIYHIPEILYHWRVHASSTADNPVSKAYAFAAGRRAIEAHLDRLGVKGEVKETMDLGFYEVRY